ncbi:MAG: hypoxanthine phosphoribosyltransferase [Cytophagaceae bacterium]|nr:hypoxanthine phosphoribosyltransferase [Cytophagaceae bacterium]
MVIKDKSFEVFINEKQINSRVKEIAQQISAEYKGKDPLIIPILNGAFLFAADLIKELTIPCQVSFVKVSSYAGMESTGVVTKLFGLETDLKSRHVIILDDIIDTGLTMYSILQQVKVFKPESIEMASFLLKPEALQKELEVKYVGFTIPNDFVVGYGLDYEGYGRNMKDIYKLKG